MHTAETGYGIEPGTARAATTRRFKLLDKLAVGRGGLVLAALAFVLTLPALRLGFMTDDRAFAEKFQRGDGPLVVYSMTGEEVAASKERGMFPWWTSPNLHLKFFRPLSALSHQLEYAAWPDAPWLMHLTNGVLYALVVLLAFYVYRELLPTQPSVAALAALMFAIDDGHATTTGWIASRSMLLATLFALASVLFHVRARARSEPLLRVVSVGCLVLSLSSAESGLATLAYLGAYALTFEKGSLPRRVATLLPELAVFAIWAVIYVSGNYGVRGVALYRELSSPLSLIAQGLTDLPAWILMLLGPSLLDLAMLQAPVPARLVATLLCLPLLAALWVTLPRTKEVRFFALGALFSLPPLFSTLPQDRLLVSASFGGFGVLASFLVVALSRRSPPRWLRVTRGVLIALHLVVAPLLFVPALGQNQLIERAAAVVEAAVPELPPRQIVLLNTPIELMNTYAWERMRSEPNRKRPDTFAQLYAGSSTLTVRRVDARTLELRPEHGWGRVPLEHMFTKIADMPRAGAHLTVSGMEVIIEESAPDGRPTRVSFRFPTPLEDAQRLFLVWEGTRPVPWQPPANGEEVKLAPLNLLNMIQS